MEDQFHLYHKPELDFYNIKRPAMANTYSKPRLAQMKTVSEESGSTIFGGNLKPRATNGLAAIADVLAARRQKRITEAISYSSTPQRLGNLKKVYSVNQPASKSQSRLPTKSHAFLNTSKISSFTKFLRNDHHSLDQVSLIVPQPRPLAVASHPDDIDLTPKFDKEMELRIADINQRITKFNR